jgi:hypothetical protein
MSNTWGKYWLSCEYFIPSVVVLNTSILQLATEASFISSISIIVVLIWIGVRLIFFQVSLLFDEMSHSGMYDGIERRFHTVTGSCFKVLLTSTWSACQFFRCHPLGL